MPGRPLLLGSCLGILCPVHRERAEDPQARIGFEWTLPLVGLGHPACYRWAASGSTHHKRWGRGAALVVLEQPQELEMLECLA